MREQQRRPVRGLHSLHGRLVWEGEKEFRCVLCLFFLGCMGSNEGLDVQKGAAGRSWAPRAALQCSRIGGSPLRDSGPHTKRTECAPVLDSSPHTAWCGRRSASISDRWLSRLSRVHSSLMASSSCAEPAVQAGKRPKSGTMGRQSQLQTCGEATRKVHGLGEGVHGQPACGTVPLGTAPSERPAHPAAPKANNKALHTLLMLFGAPHLDHVVIRVVEEQLFHQHTALHHLLPHKGDAT